MSANFYELLKYAATGIASPDMTYYDRMRASALMGGAVQTLTGIPPLSFKADGEPLISWSMKGNTQQTGTPTPDAPIMPELVGVRTGNLAKYWKSAYVASSGTVNANIVNGVSYPVKIEAGQTVCFTNQKTNFGRGIAVFSEFDGETLTDMIYRSTNNTVTYTADSDCYVIVWGNYDNITSMDESVFALCGQMLNAGSEALPYEPYGYKIPFTNAGQTTPVYLGQTPTVRRIKKRVLDGSESWTVWHYQTAVLFYTPITDGTGELIVSSHFGSRKSGSLPLAGNIAYNGASNKNMFFRMLDDTTITTVEDFKAWLAAQNAAGTPVTVWYILADTQTAIVNEPLAKIGDYADELHSTDAAVTIPTAKGQNTLTVDTDLQPSEMTITYKE